jgi:hypothetical protein
MPGFHYAILSIARLSSRHFIFAAAPPLLPLPSLGAQRRFSLLCHAFQVIGLFSL